MSVNDYKTANLQQAADYVQLSRKTLDDYFSMIRRGENYGFDFVKKANEKMGVLRQFIKEQEAKPNGKKRSKGIDIFQIWNKVKESRENITLDIQDEDEEEHESKPHIQNSINIIPNQNVKSLQHIESQHIQFDYNRNIPEIKDQQGRVLNQPPFSLQYIKPNNMGNIKIQEPSESNEISSEEFIDQEEQREEEDEEDKIEEEKQQFNFNESQQNMQKQSSINSSIINNNPDIAIIIKQLGQQSKEEKLQQQSKLSTQTTKANSSSIYNINNNNVNALEHQRLQKNNSILSNITEPKQWEQDYRKALTRKDKIYYEMHPMHSSNSSQINIPVPEIKDTKQMQKLLEDQEKQIQHHYQIEQEIKTNYTNQNGMRLMYPIQQQHIFPYQGQQHPNFPQGIPPFLPFPYPYSQYNPPLVQIVDQNRLQSYVTQYPYPQQQPYAQPEYLSQTEKEKFLKQKNQDDELSKLIKKQQELEKQQSFEKTQQKQLSHGTVYYVQKVRSYSLEIKSDTTFIENQKPTRKFLKQYNRHILESGKNKQNGLIHKSIQKEARFKSINNGNHKQKNLDSKEQNKLQISENQKQKEFQLQIKHEE